MNVVHWDKTQTGVLSETTLRRVLEKRGYRVTKYVYPPGTYFPDHTHDVDKIDGVLSGRFQLTMKGRPLILEAGDYVEVPRGTLHSAEVIGDQPVISLDAVKIQ